MAVTTDVSLLQSAWDDSLAATMSESEQLVYRSNLLGSDLRITNFGGGNTSAKITETDPLTGEAVEVLWVKGSGGDLGTIRLEGFSTLYMDRLNALKGIYRGPEHEDEMVGYLPHCTFNLNGRAASIDTPLHAFVEYKHVDHMHPDAVIAIAASSDSKTLTEEIYGSEIGWLPWRRPGFELGLWIGRFAEEHPEAKGVVLAGHGLFTWAATSREVYELTLDVINRAIAWFDEKTAGEVVFGGARHTALAGDQRRAIAARLMPAIRGRIGKAESKVGHFDDGPAVLEFVNSGPSTRWPPSAPVARIISSAPRSGPSSFPSTRPHPTSKRRSRTSARRSPSIATIMRPITIAAATTTARRCAIRTRSSTWCRASA